MNEPKDVRVDVDAIKPAKNTAGELGPICNNCGGFGYTLAIGSPSQSAGCHHCDQTGVEPLSNKELQKQVIGLAKDIHDLKQIIIKLARGKAPK